MKTKWPFFCIYIARPSPQDTSLGFIQRDSVATVLPCEQGPRQWEPSQDPNDHHINFAKQNSHLKSCVSNESGRYQMLTCSRREAHSHMEEHCVTLHGYKLLTRTDNVNIFSQRCSPVDWTTEALHWKMLQVLSPACILIKACTWKLFFLHSTADNSSKGCTYTWLID